MGLPRMSSPRGSTRRRVALWTATATGWILPSVGCQVEYVNMALAFRAGTCTTTFNTSRPDRTSRGPTPKRRRNGHG